MMTMTSSTAANLAETEKVKKNIFTLKIIKSNSCLGCDFRKSQPDLGANLNSSGSELMLLPTAPHELINFLIKKLLFKMHVQLKFN